MYFTLTTNESERLLRTGLVKGKSFYLETCYDVKRGTIWTFDLKRNELMNQDLALKIDDEKVKSAKHPINAYRAKLFNLGKAKSLFDPNAYLMESTDINAFFVEGDINVCDLQEVIEWIPLSEEGAVFIAEYEASLFQVSAGVRSAKKRI